MKNNSTLFAVLILTVLGIFATKYILSIIALIGITKVLMLGLSLSVFCGFVDMILKGILEHLKDK